MSKNQVVKYIFFGLLLSFLVFIGYYWVLPSLGLSQETECPPVCVSLHDEKPYIDPVTEQTILSLSYPSDFSDHKNLIGGANNVFVAKIIAQTGNKETSVGPRTQYTAEIIHNIKGDLSGVVTLDQLGGYMNGQFVVVEGATLDGYLLQPGSTYLLATRYNEKENWHTLNPHKNASKLLTHNPDLPDTALHALLAHDEKVRALEAAYPNEQLLDADIAHQNTRNAFRDLPPEAKAAAILRADTARAELESEKGGR